MNGTYGRRLRKVVCAVTGLLILTAVWGGVKLIFLSQPDPISPALASMQVQAVKYPTSAAEASSEISLRPLFWEGRKPVSTQESGEVTAGETGTPPEPKSQAIDSLKLLGVYGGENPGAIVIYNGEQRRIRLNESIADWKMTAMNTEGIVFESGEELRIFNLKHYHPGAQKSSSRSKGRRKSSDKKQ